MPRLGNILSDSDEIAIATSDGDIHIEYYPSRVTQKMANQFRAFGKMARSDLASEEELQEALQKMYGLLLHLIKSWDLEDEIPCGKCEVCKAHKKELIHENELDEEQDECQSKKIVPFPLQANRLEELPVWLIVEMMDNLASPNRKAPQKKKRN
jgi:hypothetical protein